MGLHQAAVLAYQIALLTDTGVVSSPEQKALTAFDYFINGCLIPIIVCDLHSRSRLWFWLTSGPRRESIRLLSSP